MTQNNQNKILLAIPVYNEARYVKAIIESVSHHCSDVLIVNDGSDDGTADILKRYEFLQVLNHQSNKGYGQSLIDAFCYARANDFEWIVTMDCDHQHQPCNIPLFYEEIANDTADIISGSRYLKLQDRGSFAAPPERVFINKKITSLLNQTLGLNLTDSFCGFKAYRVKSLEKLKLTEEGYGLPLQLWIQAARENLRIKEIPVPLIYHDPGRNFSWLLESPEFRMRYYMEIIHRELGLNGYTNADKISCT